MNSEELERSLRTEFEDYLKQISADAQREMSEFQEKIEAEFERQRTQFAEIFQDFSARAVAEKQLDAGFRESILEHLRQARDEGARITATAIAEAEEMEKESAAATAASAAASVAAPSAVGVVELRDAINDISSQNSQAAILKSLVSHAGQFTARGAFFIVKNEHFVGWRTFGNRQESNNEAVREIFFPVSDATTLGESVASLSAVEGAYGNYDGDAVYLEKLDFGKPDKMFAIPLVARGRGVAVLYADAGEAADGAEINVEALETLVRVAGLTVEVIAAAAASQSVARAVTPDAPLSESEIVQNAEETEEAKKQFGEETDSDALQQQESEVRSFDEEKFDDLQTPVYNDYSSASGVESAVVKEEIEEVEAPFDSSLTLNDEVETRATNDYQESVESYDFSTENDSQPEVAQTSFDNYSFDDEPRAQTPVSVEDEFQTIYQDGQTDATENDSWRQPAETGAQNEETHERQAENDSHSFQTEAPQYDYPASSTSVPGNEYSFETEQTPETARNEFAETLESFETAQTIETPQFESPAFDSTTPDFSFGGNENYSSYEKPAPENFAVEPAASSVEPAVATTAGSSSKPTRSRFSDKNVDLPIEVTEDERRLHNDARRFARLLVSEIKLYNEQKVKEGREANDLYERLREAVDRSREMYDKRVQPPVAAKFDYFHYEMVNTLAEGDESNLGASYPGALV